MIGLLGTSIMLGNLGATEFNMAYMRRSFKLFSFPRDHYKM